MFLTTDDILGYVNEKTLIGLTNPDNKAQSVDMTKVGMEVEFVNIFIESKLRGNFDLPLTSDKDISLLKSIALDLAVYRLYKYTSYLKMPEGVDTQWINALNMLNDISNGKINLERNGKARIRVVSQEVYLTEEKLRQW